MKYFMSETIPPDREYTAGEHIACFRQVCAFFEYTMQDYNGSRVSFLVEQLYLHGCTGCGSVPVLYPESNAVNFGVLKVDWVRHPNCTGVCKELILVEIHR